MKRCRSICYQLCYLSAHQGLSSMKSSSALTTSCSQSSMETPLHGFHRAASRLQYVQLHFGRRLLAMPLLDVGRTRGNVHRPLTRFAFWVFVGNFFLLMWIVECLTKWAIFVPTMTCLNASSLADLVLSHIHSASTQSSRKYHL